MTSDFTTAARRLPLRRMSLAWFALFAAACGGSPPVDSAPVSYARSSCLWAGPYLQQDDDTNFALLDTGAVYWTSKFTLPEGAKLRIGGDFAHGRYLSFNAYNAEGEATDALKDVDIVPDAGGINPFLSGANRAAPHRRYSIRLIPDAPPQGVEQRMPNTLYASPGNDGVVEVFYRLYVPDASSGITGGVELPAVSVDLADGRHLHGEAACAALQAIPTVAPKSTTVLPEWQYRLLREQPLRAPGFPAEAETVWHKFFNTNAYASCAYFKFCGGNPEPSGGLYNNIDNNYVYAFVNRSFGPLVVMRGKLPRTPLTRDGNYTMPASELRYWSVCSYESYTQRVEPEGCLYDETLPLDSARNYTIVMSRPQDRPANARAECGYAWLEWSPNGDGLGNLDDAQLLLRNLVADPAFAHSIQKVTAPGEETAVMGDYLPSMYYATLREFEELGCDDKDR